MKNPNNKESSTGFILILVFSLLTAGILTAGYFVYQTYKQNYRTEVERSLSAIADLKIEQIVQWRKERMEDGTLLLYNDELTTNVGQYLHNENNHKAKINILKWIAIVQKVYGYDLMILTDGQFNTKFVFPEKKELINFVIEKKNTEILFSGKIAFQDFYRNPKDNRVYLKILVPIMDNIYRSRLIGVIGLRMDPEKYLYPLMKMWPTASRTSEALIFRRDGNDVLFLNDFKYQKDAALNLRIPIENKEVLAVKAALGQIGIIEGLDYRGHQLIGYVREIPSSPWFLVASMDKSEIFFALKEKLLSIIVIVVVLILCTGAGLGFILKNQSSKTYKEKMESAHALIIANKEIVFQKEERIKAENTLLISEMLRTSELCYRRLFESCQEGILILEADSGKINDVNPFLIEMLGYPKEEMLGKELWEIGLFKNITASKDAFIELLQQYIRFDNMPLETKNGLHINVEFVSNTYLVDQKKMVQCNIRDITERMRTEKALNESENRLRNLFETMSEGIVYEDHDGKITFANPAAEKLLGLSLDQLQGRTSLDHRWKAIHEDGSPFPGETHSLNVAAKTGKPATGEVMGVYNPNLNSYVWLSVNSNAEFLPGEKVPLRAYAVFRDITKRKLAEDERQKSESMLRTVLQSTADGILAVNNENEVLYANEHFVQMWRIPREIIASKNDSILLQHVLDQLSDPECFLKSVQELYKSDIESFDMLYFKDGRVFERLSCPLIQGEKIQGRVWSFRDITERRQVERKIQLALEEKESLLREIHHRVKNNLQAMVALMKMHSKNIKDKGTQQFLKELEGQTHTMSLVYEQLYQSENLAQVVMKSYIGKLTFNVLEAFNPVEKIKLNIDIGNISLDVAHAMPCGLIVNELFTNILKHAFPPDYTKKPSVRISLRQEDEVVYLIISDNGVGMPEGFDLKSKQTLGLHLVDLWATHQLGGTLDIQSNKGATFSITFNLNE